MSAKRGYLVPPVLSRGMRPAPGVCLMLLVLKLLAVSSTAPEPPTTPPPPFIPPPFAPEDRSGNEGAVCDGGRPGLSQCNAGFVCSCLQSAQELAAEYAAKKAAEEEVAASRRRAAQAEQQRRRAKQRKSKSKRHGRSMHSKKTKSRSRLKDLLTQLGEDEPEMREMTKPHRDMFTFPGDKDGSATKVSVSVKVSRDSSRRERASKLEKGRELREEPSEGTRADGTKEAETEDDSAKEEEEEQEEEEQEEEQEEQEESESDADRDDMGGYRGGDDDGNRQRQGENVDLTEREAERQSEEGSQDTFEDEGRRLFGAPVLIDRCTCQLAACINGYWPVFHSARRASAISPNATAVKQRFPTLPSVPLFMPKDYPRSQFGGDCPNASRPEPEMCLGKNVTFLAQETKRLSFQLSGGRPYPPPSSPSLPPPPAPAPPPPPSPPHGPPPPNPNPPPPLVPFPPLSPPSVPPSFSPPSPPRMPKGYCHADCPQHSTDAYELNEAWRSTSNVYSDYNSAPYNYYISKCDYYESDSPMYGHSTIEQARWYRFTGSAGTRMPTSSPVYRTCGTDKPGWLATPHPALGDPPRSGTVCFRTGTSSSYVCNQHTKIQVCVCSYDAGATLTYLYKLPRVGSCHAAYCGTTAAVATPPTSSPPPPLPPFAAPPPPSPGLESFCSATCPQNITASIPLSDWWRNTNNRRSSSYSSNPVNWYQVVGDYYGSPESPMGYHSNINQAWWYRFEKGAGTHMPTTPPTYYSCGTRYPAWTPTEHPPRGGMRRKGKACFVHGTSSSQGCSWSVDIEMCTCSYDGGETDTYMYRFYRSPGTNGAYCGTHDPFPQPPPSPPPPPPSPPKQPPQEGAGVTSRMCHSTCPQSLSVAIPLADSYRSVHNYYTGWNSKNPGPNWFKQVCDQNSPAPMYNHYDLDSSNWYYFTGEAGSRMPSRPVGGNRCGGNYAGWLASPHGAPGSPVLGGSVCFQYRTDHITYGQCDMRVNIQTCTCTYDSKEIIYLYKLPRPPGCQANYCGVHDEMPPPPPSPPAVPPTLSSPPPMVSPPPSPLCHASCPQNPGASTVLDQAWRNIHNVYRSYSSTETPNYYTTKDDRSCNVAETPVGCHTSQTQAQWYRFGGAAGSRCASETARKFESAFPLSIAYSDLTEFHSIRLQDANGLPWLPKMWDFAARLDCLSNAPAWGGSPHRARLLWQQQQQWLQLVHGHSRLHLQL